MGLGGITRDSIVGLNNLVKDDNDDESRPRLGNRRPSMDDKLSGSWNNGSDKNTNFQALLEGSGSNNNNNDPPKLESLGSFREPLNDSPATPSMTTSSQIHQQQLIVENRHRPPSPPRLTTSTTPSSAKATAATSVSSTNSRSLDSYRTNDNLNQYYQGFQYEGYADYYSEDYASYSFDESSIRSGGSGREKKKNIFCCLFAPWAITQQQQQIQKNDDSDSPPALVKQDSSGSISFSSSIQEAALDEEEAKQDAINAAAAAVSAAKALSSSSTTPPLPMPSTDKKKNDKLSSGGVTFATSVSPQATHPHMLSVDSTSTAMSSATCTDESEVANALSSLPQEEDEDKKKKIKDQEEEESTPPPIKGILKVRRCSNIVLNAKDKKASNNNTRNNNKNKDASTPGAQSPNKRHLFPTYEPKKSHTLNDPTEIKCITFNPMARVLTIPSRKDIPLHQKAQVWWQRCDYDEFKKTGRIISKAMECGGSEIWLASSNAWGNRSAKQQQQRNSHSSSPRSVTQERSSSDSSSTEKNDLEKSEDEYQKALSKYINDDKKEISSSGSGSDSDANANATGDGNKWWCKFGHSRRGLEHIASSDEGKARQQSVLLAVRMVMEEQKRQRASRTKDPNKLRNVSMQYTSWARDLALAGGAADAEAVASGFNPRAASRAHHFAKRLNVNTSNALNTAGDLNGSCKAVAAAVTSQILDANTHAITTPRTKEKKKQAKSLGDITSRATGYMPGGGGNDVSAAAVMSGMGYQTVKV